MVHADVLAGYLTPDADGNFSMQLLMDMQTQYSMFCNHFYKMKSLHNRQLWRPSVCFEVVGSTCINYSA